MNFSTLPSKPVSVKRLTLNGTGGASYASADFLAPHLNTYSLLGETAANGGCWTCLDNTQPVDMTGGLGSARASAAQTTRGFLVPR